MDETPPHSGPDSLTRVLRWVVGIALAALVITGAVYAYAYLVTPDALRRPTADHFHFRLQIINGGQPVNFAESKYQTDFNKDICTAKLTQQPVHFHDNVDQFVHIHWKNITGGILLKSYGWNLIGGTKNTLGYRLDALPKLQRVPIHGHDLPAPPVGTRYFVYTSSIDNPTEYKQRSWDDFLHQDLRDFLGSKPAAAQSRWLDALVPAASAHGSDEELARLNDVLGNVVIFAQKDSPAPSQVKDRFEHLIDLPESACAG